MTSCLSLSLAHLSTAKRCVLSLRSSVIRLASEHPELRKHLLPLLKVGMDFPTQEALDKYLKDHPGADKSNHSVRTDDPDGLHHDPSVGWEPPFKHKIVHDYDPRGGGHGPGRDTAPYQDPKRTYGPGVGRH